MNLRTRPPAFMASAASGSLGAPAGRAMRALVGFVRTSIARVCGASALPPLLTSASLALATAAAADATAIVAPPATRSEPVTDIYHGQQVIDEYRWLEALDRESPEVESWTTAQNEYTRQRLDSLPCRTRIEDALRPLMEIGSISAPIMSGDLYFYTERLGSQNQPLVKVRRGHAGEARVLLDLNALDPSGLTSLDWYRPTHDGTLMAFGTSRSGSEMSELNILEVASGRWLADQIAGKVSFSSWSPDGRAFVYSLLRDPKDPYSREVRVHEVGSSPRFDPLILKQEHPSEIPFAELSRDGRWLITGLFRGWQANDLSAMRFDEWKRTATLNPTVIARGLDARTQPSAILGDTLWATTTLDAPNGRLVRIDLNAPGSPKEWQTVVAERPDAVLQGAQLARNMLVLTYEKDASTLLTRVSLDGRPLGDIALPGLGTASLSTDEERTEAFLTFTSFTEPRSIYRLDLAAAVGPEAKLNQAGALDPPAAKEGAVAAAPAAAGAALPSPALTLWARPEVPVDPSNYEVRQVRATSRDGTEVPMFIVIRRGTTPSGANPCLLTAYGGFNVSLTPYFNPTIIPWLDSGGVWVQANLRGGGEYGERWHRAGMLGNKQNVFDDFYACAEWLIENRWTNASKLAIEGGSNGGLLTGAAITQRPELFSAAIVAVPLLDMLRYDKFLLAKYWVPEYGSADDPEAYAWLRAYSPYHHVRKGTRYPAVLLTAGENDSRVHPLHARKMAARLQALAANDPAEKPILLWVDRDAGHGQGKPLSKRIRDEADQWAFVMWQTGLCH